ncbi:hypothetical protein CASFOL_031858 [Castilleja foliolosa]|uniref:GRAS family transcription factor n=1 Tax=Castilleja foliolosa TaxID=1961234 RepID=A0ABD3C2L2_9LAMI
MDPLSSSNGLQLENQTMPEFSNEELSNMLANEYSFQEQSIGGAHLPQNKPSSNLAISTSVVDDSYHNDCEFSDGVFRYIDQMLMEEETGDKTHMLQESLDFQAKERSFYQVIGKKYPPSPDNNSSSYVTNYNNSTISSSSSSAVSGSGYLFDIVDPNWRNTSSSQNLTSVMYSETNIENSNLGKRGKKNRHADDNNCEEERSKKLPAVYPETYNPPVEEFDDVLLHTVGEHRKKFEAYRTNLRNERSKSKLENEEIELTSLLINCARSIAVDDHPTAYELLRKIREHSSPLGDGGQRLAHYFADGLEARLSGTGGHMYKALVSKRTTVSDYLKAYYTCIASCPFFTISSFTSNKLIASKSEKAMRVHVIDFGILYGFQWPAFIQRLAERDGGPPKLRITGIDFPQPGFRPAERIEDTGRHLARYAETFNVPFEYNAIAQKWETIKIEDLKIEKGEFVVVNCMYRADNLQDEIDDETCLEECPRDMVLSLIRKIKPDIFVHGIVNGTYGVPYFVTRFREALFRFSAVYDMLEMNIPRESPERMLIEKGVFGKEALNVIACEGWERVERPESYKQWQMRHLRAGFMPIRLSKKLTDSAAYKVRKFYDRDFVIDVYKQWLLMGWKGRIIYAISCWQPV